MKSSFADRGGLWVLGQFLLMLAILFAGPEWPTVFAYPGVVALAWTFFVLGAWVGIDGALTLGKNRTAYPTPKAEHHLIQHGIYSRIRHPLYTSLLLLGLGWSFLWGSVAAILFTLLLMMLLNFKADFEEQKLIERYPDYADYRARVPKFFPRLRRRAQVLGLAFSLIACHQTALGQPQLLDLSTAIAEASRNNPDARIARSRITASEAAVMQADSLLWPQVTVRSSYQRTDNPIGVFGAALNQQAFSPGLDFNNVPDADNLNVGGMVTFPIYTGGQIAASRQAARHQKFASEHGLAATQNQLAFEVTRVFLSIQKTETFITAADAAIRSFRESRDVAKKRLESGSALKADVLDLEVRLAQAQEERVQAKNANQLARRALANLLGRDTRDLDSLPTPTTTPPQLTVPDSLPSPVRPELAASQQMTAAAQAKLRSARSGSQPKVSLFANAEHNRGRQFDGTGENYTVGALIKWNLWDGHQTRGKVREARAEAAIAAERQRQLRLAIELEREQARLNLEAATQRVTVTSKAVELATESAQLTRVRFEQGLALATQLIDAESALTSATVRLAQADTDRLIAIAALRKALGLPLISLDPTTP